MKNINLQWIYSLLIILVITGCSKNASNGNGDTESVNIDSVVEDNSAEMALPHMSPQQVIDKFIFEMKEIDRMIFSENIDGAEKRFDNACSEALMYIDLMSNDEQREAYEYWAQITKSPQIRSLDSFNFDTPTGQKFGKRIDDMRIKQDKEITSLVGKKIEFTDKAGTRFRLHLYESEQNEGKCKLYPARRNESYSGTWKLQSKDLGMSSIEIFVNGVCEPDENWNTVDRGVNFGDAHDYHNSHFCFYPSSPSGHFYIVKGKIWPYFIGTDGIDGYEQFALPYTVYDK